MAIDLAVMGAAYALLHATHGIADYWVQTDWQAQNKSKNWKALWSHILTYSLCFLAPALFLLGIGAIGPVKALLLPLVVGLPHAFMDQRGFLKWFLAKSKGWTGDGYEDLKPKGVDAFTFAKIAAVRTHVGIHLDQKYHYLCLLLTAIWLAL